ncbi:flippase activity-associated protein Agl23 [Leptolyngbya sp. 7M]|uniref:flippase activity-associated protein Agl23 n=1 Tax=Leptolyngbya sp. 7M TaxID=2812896 RepID=UPI001B8B6142|nr:flippase activity-associated protein Agl23 [Leptolyngbya sp. 7M]QYO66971.1 TIGR03663 family protein [Leptolyngbya sp. 7M]
MKGNSQPEDAKSFTNSGTDLRWIAVCSAVAVVGFLLRFVNLGVKPLHHDEGVNGWFLTNLVRQGTYAYDPENYHGPTLYYISLAFVEVFGLETVSIRWSVAIWGGLMVLLALWLRRYIGSIGSLFAALFLAISPGMVYISRYFIHEIFFVFLALAVVISILQFIEREKAGPFAVFWTGLILLVCFFPGTYGIAGAIADEGVLFTVVQVFVFAVETVLVLLILRSLLSWRDGRPIYALLAAASASLIYATKETGFITLGTMMLAIACVILWEKIVKAYSLKANTSRSLIAIFALPVLVGLYKYDLVFDGIEWFYTNYVKDPSGEVWLHYLIAVLTMSVIAAFVYFLGSQQVSDRIDENSEPSWPKFRAALGTGIDRYLVVVASLTLFVYLWVLFFSSFFSFPEGVSRSFEAYAIWAKTGNRDHTQGGPFGYLRWLMEIEAPLLVLSSLGLLIALIRERHRTALFIGFWWFGLFLAYSIIPYKTPWLMLSFTLPMCLSAGYAINELASSKDIANRIVAGVLAALACVILSWQAYDLNFVNYDNEKLPYVYAHTDRQFLFMVAEIERFAELSGKGEQASIKVVSPDYWPLVWYMRNYPNTGFGGTMTDPDGADMMIAKANAQEVEAQRRFGRDYLHYGTYKLRPGVELMLWVRKDIAAKPAKGIATEEIP